MPVTLCLGILKPCEEDWMTTIVTSSDHSSSPDDLRKLVDTTRQGTHWEGCWKSHKDCAILAAAARIEALEKVLRKIRFNLGVDSGWLDQIDAALAGKE